MLQLATKNKANIERALQDFLSLASMEQQGRDNVGAILGMSIAYQLLKQTPRARNQLKRVFKRGWNFDDAEYLERCWLLLADIYIQVDTYNTVCATTPPQLDYFELQLTHGTMQGSRGSVSISNPH